MKLLNELIEQIKSKKRSGLIPEIGWVISGQLLSIVLGFVIVKLLSKMGTEGYGIYALIITISLLLVQIFYGPLQQGFIRFYYHYRELNLVKIYISLFYKILFASIIALIFITFFVSMISPLVNLNVETSLMLLTGAYLIAIRINELFNSLLNLIRKRKENAIISASEKIVIIF